MRTAIITLAIAAACAAQPYNGTAVGSPTYTTGLAGQGLTNFSSNTNYATLPPGWIGTGNRTHTFWVKVASTAAACSLVHAPGWTIFMATGGNITFEVSGSEVRQSYAPNLTAGVWSHIEAVLSSNAPIVFRDGLTYGGGSALTVPLPAAGTLRVGDDQGYDGGAGNPECSATVIDGMATWNTALHTSAFTPPAGVPTTADANLRALWQFDGNLNESAPVALVAGTLTQCVGVCASAPNNVPATYQWEKATYTGSTCGTFADFGSALTSQSGAVRISDTPTPAAPACYRMKYVNGTTVYSNVLVAPSGSSARGW
jgi:hypothetical protein